MGGKDGNSEKLTKGGGGKDRRTLLDSIFLLVLPIGKGCSLE